MSKIKKSETLPPTFGFQVPNTQKFEEEVEHRIAEAPKPLLPHILATPILKQVFPFDSLISCFS